MSPLPSEAELDAFYQDSSFYDAALEQLERVRQDFEHRLDLLERLRDHRMPRTLVDVGCAAGLFLESASRRGWSVEGVERSHDLSAAAAARSGAHVHPGRLETAPRKTFGVVVSWEVIEHVEDVREFFRQLADRVDPGGVLALSTPLSTGLPARLMGTRFPMICPPEHLRIFSRASIGHLAKKQGLTEIHYESFSNLGTENLASGIHRLTFGERIGESTRLKSRASRIAAGALSWAPRVVDQLGWGSEMVVVFRKPCA